ncbi:MAG: F0F1 ATP synthase subunit A [Patescibacteria group bacterium]
MLHISLAPETIFRLWGFPITNSLLTTWLVMLILILFAYLATRHFKKIPSRFQVFVEILVGGLHDFFSRITGSYIRDLFPVTATLFIFIIVANWSGLLPGVGTIGFYHEAELKEIKFVPILRAPTADINTTLALALIAIFLVQYYGFKVSGLKYGKKFINLTNPIFFFVGILEIISDLSKIISFTFRLFGNIFAGEVLLAVIAFLIPFIVPLPFLALELFVGFIQALVFSMLYSVFVIMAVSHGEVEHGGEVKAHG